MYFKEHDKMEWSGPAKVIGQEGKVVFLIYGNNLRRVHCSKLVKEGLEFENMTEEQENDETDEASIPDKENEEEDTKGNTPQSEDSTTVNENNAETNSNVKKKESKRKSPKRMPAVLRKIKFKGENDHSWTEGEVVGIGSSKGLLHDECEILLPNDDILKLNLAEINYDWEYCKFECTKCDKTFDNKKGLSIHDKRTHPESDVFYGKENKKLLHTCSVCGKEELDSIKLVLHKYKTHESNVKSCMKRMSGEPSKSSSKVTFTVIN